jgi:tetratricopeptide (TPR) repeat protein
MKQIGLVLGLAALSCAAAAQGPQGGNFKLALTEHHGQLRWNADGFKIIQSSAKPEGREIGIRGQDASGRLSFLAFLFLVPEESALTSAKCRDQALSEERKDSKGLTSIRTREISRQGDLPLSLATYTTKTRDGAALYHVRGFLAENDICGDLEFYSDKSISDTDANLAQAFSSYQFDKSYTPAFADITLYGQILYESKMYEAAAPIFEKALAIVPTNGSPFPSAKIARRVLTDQAGMSYGISGNYLKARAIFEAGIAADPEYPMYYYNLACADAGENKLADASLHLQEAFARKANVIPGETMPDPTEDDSFLPYKSNREFWTFVTQLQSAK